MAQYGGQRTWNVPRHRILCIRKWQRGNSAVYLSRDWDQLTQSEPLLVSSAPGRPEMGMSAPCNAASIGTADNNEQTARGNADAGAMSPRPMNRPLEWALNWLWRGLSSLADLDGARAGATEECQAAGLLRFRPRTRVNWKVPG